MASAMNHKKRSHRSEKMHMASVRQMKQFSPQGGRNPPPGDGHVLRLWAAFPGAEKKERKADGPVTPADRERRCSRVPVQKICAREL